MTTQELVTIEEAAAEFGVHRTTLFRAISEGRLPRHTTMGDRHTYVGRWDVQRLVDPPAVARCLELIYRPFTTTGDWPVATDIQRKLDRDGETYDFLAALETLPQELGWRVRDLEGRAQLTLRGMARCINSGDDVAAFLAAVRTCYQRYISDATQLKVKSAELAEAFGFDNLMLIKLHKMLQLEAALWTSLGGNAQGWELEIDVNRIRHFRNVESITDYLAAKDQAFKPGPRPQLSTFYPVGESIAEANMDLHPSIAKALGGREAEGNPTGSVVAAAAAFEGRLAERLREEKLFGQRLVNAYFDTALQAGHPNPRRVESLRSIVLGAVGAYRNPAAHGRQEFDPVEAREIVGLFSLLTREADALPMPQNYRWSSYREASQETREAFAVAGHRRGVLPSPVVANLPMNWFCEDQQGFVDREDLGLTFGEGVEPMPVCPKVGCTARGWERVHPIENMPSQVVGSGGQPPTRVFNRVPKKGP